MNLSLTDMRVISANQLTIRGVPTLTAKRIKFNVGLGEDNIALHFDVRFDYLNDHRTIVLNSMQNGSYGTEKREKHFFFQEGKEFKVKISFNQDEFQINIPDNYIISFPNCFGENEYKFIQVNGDVRIKSFNID